MNDLRQGLTMKAEQDGRDDTVHFRLPSDVREVIEREAARECRSLSGQLRFLVCYAIEARAQQHT
jgi:hypothetical protein